MENIFSRVTDKFLKFEEMENIIPYWGESEQSEKVGFVHKTAGRVGMVAVVQLQEMFTTPAIFTLI